MGNKKFIFISLLILAIGFAAVSTTLYITGNVAYQTKKSNFDVYFSGAELDNVDVSNEVIKDKKHIEYTSNELKKLNDISVLKYEVTNDSTEYDATVTISCTPMKTAYFDVTLNPVTFDIDAGEIKTGEIEAKLIKVSETEQNINIDCELDVRAKERTSIETILEKNDNYKISGVLTNSSNDSLNHSELLFKSESQIVKTDRNGYFYVENLERGRHHIYYKEDGDYELSDEELEEYLIAEVSTNGYLKLINKDYKINNLQYGIDINDEGIYCEYDAGKTWNIPYQGLNGYDGSIKDFDIPCDGTYELEVWGAQGGNSNKSSYKGGYGAYSVGDAHLNHTDTLYVVVGGQGESGCLQRSCKGGYNGGGFGGAYMQDSANWDGGGGGATHISTQSGLLYELDDYKGTLNNTLKTYVTDTLLIVAGAGGGAMNRPSDGLHGGQGGGYIGGNSQYRDSSDYWYTASGGSQTTGGIQFASSSKYDNQIDGSFGKGGTYRDTNTNYNAPGGGAGFFGGGNAGGGGSGYIASTALSNKAMYCYSCSESSVLETKTISTIGSTVGVDKTNCPSGVSGSAISKCAKSGNGHARITLISLD